MPRKPRPLSRDSGVVRDATLIVIASEDKDAVKAYFDRFRTKRVQFVVLPTEDGKSSPESVLSRLDEHRTEYEVGEGDQLWLCIDYDHWVQSNHVANLLLVLQQCEQKGYFAALSNPCFELWWLLHFGELGEVSSLTCEEVARRVRTAAGGYTKRSGPSSPVTSQMVEDAVERARLLDKNPSERLPAEPMTRVYRIVREMKQREMIDLR